jgi:hypothetical protein
MEAGRIVRIGVPEGTTKLLSFKINDRFRELLCNRQVRVDLPRKTGAVVISNIVDRSKYLYAIVNCIGRCPCQNQASTNR